MVLIIKTNSNIFTNMKFLYIPSSVRIMQSVAQIERNHITPFIQIWCKFISLEPSS